MTDEEKSQKHFDKNFSTQYEELKKLKPYPVADRDLFIFNDLKKDQVRQSSFILRNIGGPYKTLELFIPDDEKFVEIVEKKPLDKNQADKLPLKVTFKAKAQDWSRHYTNTIVFKLDDSYERIVIELDTQTKPVNDFAKIFSPAEIKKMTSLIDKLEKTTTAEMAVVTVKSLEGKTIEKFANDLFNEWGIGKENVNNGVLFLIDPEDRMFRIEIGSGLEDCLPVEFINELFLKYAKKYFSTQKFGYGSYIILSELYAEIYKKYRYLKKD